MIAASSCKHETRRTVHCFASAFVAAFLSLIFLPRTCANWQDNLAPLGVRRDFSDLQLPGTRKRPKRSQLQTGGTDSCQRSGKPPQINENGQTAGHGRRNFLSRRPVPECRIAWKRAEAITPLDERSRFTLAMAYIELRRRDWARPELEKLAAAEPRNSLYTYWLARLDYDAQNDASAIARLQEVIELDPDMVRAYDTLSLCFDYVGKFEEAIKNYDRAVQLNRLQPKPAPWPHVDLAISLMALNRLPDAEKSLREAIEYGPKLPQAYYQLGRALEMQGRYEEAVPPLNQATTLDPSYPEPHYLLGRIYHRLGDNSLSKAEPDRFQELKKASELQPLPNPSLPPR